MKQTESIITTLFILLICVPAMSLEKSDALYAARSNYEKENYSECADYYKQAIELGAKSGDTYYNYACCLALSGEKDKAFDNLEKALEHGFVEIPEMTSNKDLVSLHNDKRWLIVVSKGEKYQKKYLDSINVWVYRMFLDDQADRENYQESDDWEDIANKDRMRRDRIKRIIENDGLKVSDDYFHAAMIMHHGTEAEDYKLANELAARAVELDSTNNQARWLYAASKDRYLLKNGEPQIFGTQYNYRDGLWTLEPFDKNAVTEKEREFWRVPSVAEAQRKVARLNEEYR